MREVSCRVFDLVFRALRKRGLPEEALIRGTGLTIARLKDKQERIDWADYVSLMTNVGAIWSEPELLALGGAFLELPVVRWITSVARLLFTPRDFYEWATRDGAGAADSLFSCIRTTCRDLGPNRLELTLTLTEGHVDCPEFFLITQGAFMAYPRVLGLPEARVTMTRTERGARYEVEAPPGGGKLAWLRRGVTLPIAALSTARELKQAHASLQSRYRELESARATLDRQAKLLRIAHRIAQLVHAEMDLDRVLEAVAEALVTLAGFVRAEVRLDLELEGKRLARTMQRGEATPRVEARHVTLSARGRLIGELRLWADGPPEDAPSTELLDLIVPTIALALDDALSFAALVDYRKNLEEKVTLRTTELRGARDELAETVARLEEALRVRDRIFANVNHEIRTPLSLIVLAVGALKRRAAKRPGEPEGADGDDLRSIEGSARRLLRMVDGLLLLATGRAGKLELRPAVGDLASTVREMVDVWSAAARAQGIRLDYVGLEHCTARVDFSALEQVLANLLSNAIKFTASGGRVEVEVALRGDRVEIAVRDTGVGLDDEFKKRMFGRFEQGAQPLRAGVRGSGIGLSIVRELVEAHGGRVEAEGVRGGGSIFRIQIPRGNDPESVAPPQQLQVTPGDFGLAPSPAAGFEVVECAGKPIASVLIAEDDEALRRALGPLLREEYRVLLAPDGFTALEVAAREAPDILVTDINMPGIDGFEVCRRFRGQAQNRLAPVILLTAHGTLPDRLTGFDAGAVDFVLKPFEPEELRARIRTQLQLRSLALRLHETEKLAALGQMVSGVAHELRNPANGIVNALRPLRSRLSAEAAASGSPVGLLLDVLDTCAGQLAALSRNLLELNRSGELTRSVVELPELVSRAEALVMPAFADVRLEKDLRYTGAVECAGALVIQVLVNLLENGAQAAGSGGWVLLRSGTEDRTLVVEVTDSGPGVPRPMRERVFEPFFTTKEPGRGTGLGLTISRTIAAQHGGVLKVADGVRSGLPCTVFRLELPLGSERV